VATSGAKGHGLFTLVDLKPGDFVMEYVGEILNRRQFKKRVRLAEAQKQRHFYFMTIKNGKTIDASLCGNLARFMNHSCNPNCETQKWTVNGRLHVGLFAKRPIKADTELTFDYKFVRYGETGQPCFCGEPNCKGIIGEEPKKEQQIIDIFGSDDSDPDSDDLGSFEPELPVPTDQIAMIVKALLRSDPEQTKVLLSALLQLESPEEGYKQFLHFHGLKVLSSLKSAAEAESLLLKVLLELPLTNYRQVKDSGIEKTVDSFGDSQERAKLLEKWGQLSTEYHIPLVPSAASIDTILRDNSEDDPMTLDIPEHFKRHRQMVMSVRSRGSSGSTNSALPSSPYQQHQQSAPSRHIDQHRTRRPRSPPPPVHSPSVHPQLPPNWRVAKSPQGQTYYYNEVTKETSWDPPTTANHSHTSHPAPASSSSIALPTHDQACRIVDNSISVARLNRPLDARTRIRLADELLREFKDASYVDLTEGRYKSFVDRFIGDRLYNIQSGR
jgi:histone-lysine N-methyltransferase SETD2